MDNPERTALEKDGGRILDMTSYGYGAGGVIRTCTLSRSARHIRNRQNILTIRYASICR